MTIIENDSPKVIYQGPFAKGQLLPLTFPYSDKTHVHMMIDNELATLNIEYAIITETSEEFPVAYPDSAYLKVDLPNAGRITVFRETPLDQQAAFPQNAKFSSVRIEGALDKLCMQQQEQRETLERCMKASIATENFDGSIPIPEPNRALKINSTGTGFELSDFDPDQAMIDTEHFKNQAIEAVEEAEEQAQEAKSQAQTAANQAQIATSKVEEITELHNEISGLGDKIIKDADAIINRVGLNMFDTVVKDHKLSYPNDQGLALQGTWVYKEAIAGERYGYPDFYNKCLEEYKTSTIIHTSVATDRDWVHPSIVTDYTYSGIRNFYEPEFNELFGDNTGSLVFNDAESYLEWGLGENVAITGFQITIDCYLEDTYNTATASLYSVDEHDTETLIATGGLEEVGGMTVRKYHSTAVCDGVVANRLRLRMNGTSVKVIRIEITAKETDVIIANRNGHVFYDIALKSQVDEIFTTTGMAWMYGIDQENERIFLPRNVWFEQMSMDDVGKAVEAGLPTLTTNSTGAHFHYEFASNGRGTSKDSKDEQQLNNSSQVSSLWYSGYAAYNMARNSNAANVGKSSSAGAHTHTIAGTADTVQPNAVKKLLYICVGNQVADTSWVDVVTQVQGGVKDIEDKRVQSLTELEKNRKQALTDLNNKENAGLSALANASNALRTTQITNCLTEVPQRIKYTLVDGTLTIKAGTVVIVPYGVEDLTAQYPKGATFLHENFKVYDTQFADGKFFVWAELQNDISKSTTDNTHDLMPQIYFDSTLNELVLTAHYVINYASGETPPTNFKIYYNTLTNIVKSTTLSERIYSFPIMLTTGAFTSIKQVFNSMGYIGSTVWVDKGVKGLIPNGRNEDGTLRSIAHTTPTLLVHTQIDTTDVNRHIIVGNTNMLYLKNYGYDSVNNYVYNSSGGTVYQGFLLAEYLGTASGVTNFQLKQPFRAVDYSQVDGQWVDSVSALSSATAIGVYTIDLSEYLPNDGYMYEIWCRGYLSRSDTSGTNSNLYIRDGFGSKQTAAQAAADGSNFQQGFCTGLVVVDANRKIEVEITGVALAGGNVYALKYRRLGTNA